MSTHRDWQRRAVTPEDTGAGLRTDLSNLALYHLHTSGPSPFAEESQAARMRSVSLFTGPALRKPIEERRADFMPIFLSDIPALFRSGSIRLDAALVHRAAIDRFEGLSFPYRRGALAGGRRRHHP